jgi:hypothetical protein
VIDSGIKTLSYTATSLVLGTTYEFTVESRNSIDYSEPSSSLTILHAIPPATPGAPTTTNSGTDVVIDWSEPDNNGAAITSYTVLIEQSDGSFTADGVNCDGSDSSIVSVT